MESIERRFLSFVFNFSPVSKALFKGLLFKSKFSISLNLNKISAHYSSLLTPKSLNPGSEDFSQEADASPCRTNIIFVIV